MMKKLSKSLSLSLAFSLSILMLTLPVKGEVIANQLEPFSFTVFVDCDQDGTPEDIIDISGELHVLITETTNNNVSTTKMQFVPRNVTGTGAMTGATYRGVGLTTQTATVTTGGALEFSLVNNFYLIGQGGEGYRYLVHENEHITVDANGNLAVSHDNAFVRCPGS